MESIAEYCVTNKLPVVEFAQWYVDEGVFIDEGILGNMAGGAAMGAGAGSAIPGIGTGIGAGVGALGGAGKWLWDKYKAYKQGGTKFVASRDNAMQALLHLQSMLPPGNQQNQIAKIAQYIGNMSRMDKQKQQQQAKQQPSQQVAATGGQSNSYNTGGQGGQATSYDAGASGGQSSTNYA